MAVPSAIKITKNGVKYINQVDRTKYLLKELVHQANKDVGKYITNRTKQKIRNRTGKARKNTQYWARKDGGLQVGYKPAAFYMGFDELGTNKRKQMAQLSNTVQENLDEIRRIQGTYIKSIEDENKALGLIDEREEQG